MDALYFKTDNRNALLKELGIPDEFQGKVYESPNNWVFVWIGKVPATYETRVDAEGLELRIVKDWKEGEFFNIYLKGQDNMDFFTQKVANANLIAPETPSLILL